MNYDLPTSIEIRGTKYEIRSDYRAALDILAALNDPELDGREKTYVALNILFPDFDAMPQEHYKEAIEKCLWYLNGGEVDEDRQKHTKLVDWEQDIKSIIPPINKVLGQEVRAIPYDREHNTGGLHWWTFLGAFYEIGDCLFAQIVRVRDLLARGKKLDKTDREFYNRNRALVDFKTKYTEADDELVRRWT